MEDVVTVLIDILYEISEMIIVSHDSKSQKHTLGTFFLVYTFLRGCLREVIVLVVSTLNRLHNKTIWEHKIMSDRVTAGE